MLTITLTPNEALLAVALSIFMGLLQQGEWGRDHQALNRIEPEGAGGVQIPHLAAIEAGGEQAGEGGRIGRKVLAGAAGEGLGREQPAQRAVENPERFEQDQMGKGQWFHADTSARFLPDPLFLVGYFSSPAITRPRSSSH